MKTMCADAAEDSAGLLFDSDGFDCDISVSLGDILAILDEKPQSQLPDPSIPLDTTVGFQHGELVTNQLDLEKTFGSQAESATDCVNFGVRGSSQSNLENASGTKRETGFDFLPEPQENINDMPDNGNHASLNSSHYQSDWLGLSYANNNYAMNAFGGSNLFSRNFSDPQHVSSEGVGDAVLLYPPAADVNDFYANSEMERNEMQEFSHNTLQNGETGASHELPTELFFPIDGIHSCVSSGALPESTVEDGNIYSSLSYIDPDASVTDIFQPNVNNFEATNDNRDGSNGFFPIESSNDAEFYLDQTVSAQFSPLPSFRNGKLLKMEGHMLPSQNSYWQGDVKLSTKEESPDSTLPDVLTDMGVSSPDELYDEYNDSDDMSLISESSTDSSPVPSSRNSSSSHVDGSILDASDRLLSGPNATWPNKPRLLVKKEMGDKLLESCHKRQGDRFLQSRPKQNSVLKDGTGAVQNNISRSTVSVEDDADIRILDDISDPVCLPRPPARLKQHPFSQHSASNYPHHRAIAGMGLRANDERLTLRMALEDLSQSKSEANPPDGLLAVPLLRHQRIALSWMVQKETNILCSGGILADDQGLGKTVSTIALILMERSPSSRSSIVAKKEDEFEALNLDDDDDAEISAKQSRSCISLMSKPVKIESSVPMLKGRPAAGTLVVCPTSVLRQWADELQSKVTSKANLSFLVYHGGNRTKDPYELAKYDVVLTTYAIVSMEVPKQPLVDKDDEEKGMRDTSHVSSAASNGKKRKSPPTSDTKFQKGRGTTDSALLESTAKPLGRVGWFRVILDEAQSIKNHRTQVARACWGLRAKRRWCLSGTPIQNAIDDLYSYFRFLKFDPYAAYQKFCSTLKVPISRNPTSGYKKLQTVLKTIMLRRTKGTLLDGKPIITLPSKTISLEKVDFSAEEREFYSALEAESREQFMEYEDAGTVKQNYVNILLMLLRLRQACDHPLLVKRSDSNSSQRSSMEMVKKLPRDKRIVLLSCLEVSLAICTFCNDPPEDAVVTICGHVFCNQCICEHLTGEENICPSPNCKERLSAASVFSRRTLRYSLSDHLGDDLSSGSPDFETGDNCGTNWSAYSSKIKAALAILQSLPKSQCCSRISVEKSDGGSSLNPFTAVSVSSSSGIKQTGNVSEKAIVFSQWTRMLDLLEIPLKNAGIGYRRLDGTMSVAARDKAIKDFNSLPEVTVIIMSLKAASLGLNLVAANHVLLLDLWWNPTTEDQAIDRAHRIGQTRPVTVSRLTVKDTVEDKILSLQGKKREMVASAFGEDESGSRQTRLTVDDLRYLFTS